MDCHAKFLCPPVSPRVCSDSYPLSQWCYLTVSFSAALFFCLQSFPASESFPVSLLFSSGGQSNGASASTWVFPTNIQGWFPLGLTGLISLHPKGLSRVFSSTTVQNHQLLGIQPCLWSNSHILHDSWKKHSVDYTDLCRQSDVSAFWPTYPGLSLVVLPRSKCF